MKLAFAELSFLNPDHIKGGVLGFKISERFQEIQRKSTSTHVTFGLFPTGKPQLPIPHAEEDRCPSLLRIAQR